jgi:uncharacterized protein (TIGR03437 family)
VRLPRYLLPILAAAGYALGQTYTISTLAGGGLPVNLPGTLASLGLVEGVAADSHGNVFIAATNYNIVLRLDTASGMLTLVAGNGTSGFSGDNGPATSAQLSAPCEIALDAAGNLYIPDPGNNRIRKVSNGVITTVAGNGTKGYGGDSGPATNAELSSPGAVAVDAAGNLYIADAGNQVIRKVSNGVITTVAGGGTGCTQQTDSWGDGCPATSAPLIQPAGMAVDTAGGVYIADASNRVVRKVSGGIIGTVAGVTGNVVCEIVTDLANKGCPATLAELYGPQSVALDAAGNLYIADGSSIRAVSAATGVITTAAGTGTPGFGGDSGPATSAQLWNADSIALDAAGNLYIGDCWNMRARKVSGGIITTIAGNGSGLGGDGGPAIGAQLDEPAGIAVDSAGDVFVGDLIDSRIRKVSSGVIAAAAIVGGPWGIAVDAAGDLFATESNAVVELAGGVGTTVAGGGVGASLGDGGPATEARLYLPYGVALDSAGDLYIADTFNNRIRKVTNGIISTVAGCSLSGSCEWGDGVPASSAYVNSPMGVTVDSSGRLYFSDTNNNRVRMVSNGIVTTVAGSGYLSGYLPGFGGDGGPATSAQLNFPWGLAADSLGNLYIADECNGLIRKVSGGVITTIAGGGTAYGENIPATSAQIGYPAGIAVDSAGNVYITDSGANRVHVLTPSGTPCAFTLDQLSFADVASAGSGLVVNVQTASGCAWAVQSLPDWIAFSGNPLDSGPGSVTLVVAPNVGAARSGTVSIAGITVPVSQAIAPLSIAVGGVVNDASYTAPVAPGRIAAAFGDFTLETPVIDATWPTGISDLSLDFSTLRSSTGTLAPLFFVSGGQVNLQVPWELAGQSTTTLTASLNGKNGDDQIVSLAPYAPAIFSMNSQGTGQGAILDAISCALVDSTHPATAGGTYLSIYCTGLGAVTSQPATGAPASGNPLSWTKTVPTVTIGGVTATGVPFYGLAPGFVGLYQVNALVPAASAKGTSVPVTISIGGATSNPVTIAVQ